MAKQEKPKHDSPTANILGQETSRNKLGMRDPEEQTIDDLQRDQHPAHHGIDQVEGDIQQRRPGSRKDRPND